MTGWPRRRPPPPEGQRGKHNCEDIEKRERYHQLVKQTRPVVLQSTEELPVKSQDKIEPIVQDGENALKLQPFSSAFQTKDAKG